MIRFVITLIAAVAGVLLGALIATGLYELDLPLAARLLAAVGAMIALLIAARLVMILTAALEARRLVKRRMAELRALTPPDDLPRAPDPTPGTIRRARQSRPKPRPLRKRRTGRWG
jgi:small-conductance mechanosensitive channel